MTKIALIPAYEPDERLTQLVKELTGNKYTIVVVNDGSGKEYNKIFNSIKKEAKVIAYEKNQGKGHALKTGLEYIQKNYPESIIVTMDADGQHTVKDANKLCEYVKEHPKHIALGSRFRSKKTPLRSKIGNTITMIVFTLLTGTKIYDTQTGLRAFSSTHLPFLLSIEGNRYEYEMNVLLNLNKHRIRTKEIPIEVIYIDNNKSSHFKTIRDSYLIYKEIIKFSGSSIISFIIDYLLYSIMLILTGKLIFSNITARLISGTVNYTINKNIVFKSTKNSLLSAIYYIFLAIIILILNTLILKLLVTFIGINAYIAKILTELILFIISYTVQKRFVFK
ncbi:MAG: bifunctional glycosyltransferase family 2/GtrA family protein [Bacilli bacterium]|nr:bifunctional glycosyltransferase family 2/GtrA family protein [Bacilli bacterium]